MIAAWSKEADAFLCYYTGVKLEDYSTKSPFYLTFDHPIPGDNSKLLVSARFINELKQFLTEDQFRRNIPLLAEHFKTGSPIDPGLFHVGKYPDAVEAGPNVADPEAEPGTAPSGRPCVICGEDCGKRKLYCPRCYPAIYNERDRPNKWKALTAALDRETGCFRCHYTGFRLDLDDPMNPWHLNFDHRIPHQDGDYVVTCRLVNNMKTELSDEEFKKVVIELAKHFTTGEPYDRDIIQFEYWDRPRR